MSHTPQTDAFSSGFADPVFDAQSAFRTALNAMSYAGRPQTLPQSLKTPEPLGSAAGAVALALFDLDTPVWLDAAVGSAGVIDYLRFHCGAPITGRAADARFALIAGPQSMPGLSGFDIGEDRYPDRSATVIIEVQSLTEGPATRWTGPGIAGEITVSIAGVSETFWSQWAGNRELYPQGVDVIFTSGNRLIGLPRTIDVEA